jgi:hypothetical protein
MKGQMPRVLQAETSVEMNAGTAKDHPLRQPFTRWSNIQHQQNGLGWKEKFGKGDGGVEREGE